MGLPESKHLQYSKQGPNPLLLQPEKKVLYEITLHQNTINIVYKIMIPFPESFSEQISMGSVWDLPKM